MIYEVGDLVQVKDDCAVTYFRGRIALVAKAAGHDVTDHSHGLYYSLQFSDGEEHIFPSIELSLLSKAERK
mgnify:FL=1